MQDVGILSADHGTVEDSQPRTRAAAEDARPMDRCCTPLTRRQAQP